MKIQFIFIAIHLLFFLQYIQSPCKAFSLDRNAYKFQSWQNITNTFTSGSTKGFLSYVELQSYLRSIKNIFPELVIEEEVIGETYEKRKIHALGLTLKNTPGEEESQSPPPEEKPRVLFTGFIHGNDFMSTAMIVYLTNYLIYGYIHEYSDILYLLRTREIWIVPVINADAYSYVSKFFEENNRTCIMSKNRRQNDPDNLCGEYKTVPSVLFGIGVDLNRNFDIYFEGVDLFPRFDSSAYINSPEYICKPFYKGTAPFSEPETMAIRDLLNNRSFQVGVNLMGCIECH